MVRLELRVEGPWTLPVEEPIVPRGRLLRLVAMVLSLQAGLEIRLCLCSSALRRKSSPSSWLWCSTRAEAGPWRSAIRGRAQLRPRTLLRPRRGSDVSLSSRKVLGRAQNRVSSSSTVWKGRHALYPSFWRWTESEMRPLLTVSPNLRATLSRKGILSLAFNLIVGEGWYVGVDGESEVRM